MNEIQMNRHPAAARAPGHVRGAGIVERFFLTFSPALVSFLL